MRILFNCTVNCVGGAIQNASNFICIALKDKNHDFLFAVSLEIYNTLARWGELDDRIFKLDHPLQNKETQKTISLLEETFKPDIVYTMAGPTYLKFKSKHILGISDAYITHAPIDMFFYQRNIKDSIIHLLKSITKSFLSRKEGNYFIFQTETARKNYCRRYFLTHRKTAVISNAIGKSFYESEKNENYSWHDLTKNKINIFVPSAYYHHKDLYIIKRMALFLRKNPSILFNKKLIFTVTVDKNCSFANKIQEINKITKNIFIVNHGPYSYTDAKKLYDACDIVFMPSILETFSTSYLEALAANKFLIAANKDFSREICAEAAFYFKPKSATDAINTILSIIDLDQPNQINAQNIIKKYGNFNKRYKNIIDKILHFSHS